MPAVPACFVEPLWVQFAALLPQRPVYHPNHPLGCHKPRVSDRVIFEKLVQRCDELLDTDGALRRVMVLFSGEAFPAAFRPWADEVEQEATTLRSWEPIVVPGLLQTADYARAVLRAGRPDAIDEKIEELVTARLTRRKTLDREDPPRLWFVVDESVLHRQAGCRKVMHEQLQALVEAAERSNVTIQVVPTSAGIHAGHLGAFALASLNGKPDVVYLENAHSGQVSDQPEDVRAIANIWEAIHEETLPTRTSLEIITKVMEQMDLTGAVWRKSRRSSGNGANCVEVARDRRMLVRDSKDPDGPRLALAATTWARFVADVKAGRHDL